MFLFCLLFVVKFIMIKHPCYVFTIHHDLRDCGQKFVVTSRIFKMKLTTYSLVGNTLWGDHDFCMKVLDMNGSKIKTDSLCEQLKASFGNSYFYEPRKIDSNCIPKLKGQIGLFCTRQVRKYDDIIEGLEGTYYMFNNWWLYGKAKQENNVIGFEWNGNDIVFEPLPRKFNSAWKWINDSRGHVNKKKANCIFDIDDNNEYGLPLLSVKALSRIFPSEQYYLDYGNDYWMKYKAWLLAKQANKK